MNVKGYLDGIKESSIEGWGFNLDNDKAIILDIYINGEYKGSTEANKFRKGLKSKGIHQTGRCGFKFDLVDNIDINDVTKIEVKTKIGRQHLKNSPMNIKTSRLKIFYMHIPKTAGSSLNADISTNFPNINKRSHIEGVLGTKEEGNLKNKNFLSGHLSFPKIIEKFPVNNWDFITLIRNPIDQLESHINWVIKVTEDLDSNFSKGHGNLIVNISYALRDMNLETQAGKLEFVRTVSTNDHFRNLFENCQTKYFVGPKDRFIDSNDLYNAIKIIQSSFLLTGISDDYNGFLKALTEHFGFNYLSPSERKNINKKKKRFFITEEDKQIIYDLIKFDNLLYNFTKIKWHEFSKK